MNRIRLFGGLLSVIAMAGCADLLGYGDYKAGTGGAGTGTNSGAGGATSTGTGGTACAPLSTQSCYGGPDGTEGVGVCHAGVQVCAADGSAWGDCQGEVVPGNEDCATPDDDDCDGEANEADAGCGCTPDATEPCYDGPPWTLGIGPCAGGTRTCDASGAWGACTGQVLPAVEQCGTPADESCDGSGSCSGVLRWAKAFDAVKGQYGNGAAVDRSGNILVTGRIASPTSFGGPMLAPAGDGSTNDVFVVKLDPNGKHLWSTAFGDASQQLSLGVATDATGNVLVTGSFQGDITLGSEKVTSKGGNDVFVAKLDPDGKPLWIKAFGDVDSDAQAPDNQVANAVAVDAAGDVVIVGRYLGTPDFGTGPLPSATSTGNHAYALKLAGADGHALWSTVIDGSVDTDFQRALAVAVDGAGDVVIAGYFKGSATFGAQGTVPCAGQGAFVAKLGAADGAIAWKRTSCDATAGNNQRATGVGVDAAGNVFVGGWFAGKLDLGAGPTPTSAGAVDIFLAKLDPAGVPQLVPSFGDAGVQRALGLTVDGAGNVALYASNDGAVDLGGGARSGVVVAKFDGQLGHLWSRGFLPLSGELDNDVTASDAYPALAAAPTGDLAWTGGLVGAVDFGGGVLAEPTGTKNDVFIALLAP